MSITGFRRTELIVWCMAVATSFAIVYANDPPKAEEHERKIKEADVPKAALEALKKLAGTNALTEFSEEIEHGITYYEGSWKGTHGNVDALVTANGDLVEIEEKIPVENTPKAVIEKARAAAGSDASLYVEKKTLILYEVKFRKGGRMHEVIYSPDGRQHEHEDETENDDDDD